MGLLDKFMYNDIFKGDLHKIGSGLIFQFIRLLGSTPYLLAISFRVLSPSKSSSTTFALKSALYVFF